jgi:UDP-3-O-[3-hydroxymyristoyl] N-acetylglucosamine deacetylase
LKNTVVVRRDRVLNDDGLRFPDEFVRHKLLDSLGDLYLAGAPLRGRFIGRSAGHTMHNKLLRALFADAAAWRLVDDTGSAEQPLPVRRAVRA